MMKSKYYTPPNRLAEVEREVVAAIAKVAYFVSPKIVRRITELNLACKSLFERDYGQMISCGQYFYEGSACVFPGVRRQASGVERQLSVQKYHDAHKAILDANLFPRHIWSFICGGNQYTAALWKRCGLGAFELAHVLPHKSYEVSAIKNWFGIPPAGDPSHGLFTCAANVILIPKGMVRPTDGLTGGRLAVLSQYYKLYDETHAAGFAKLCLPPDMGWCGELVWNDPVEPADWEDRVKKLDEFRKRKIRALLSANHQDITTSDSACDAGNVVAFEHARA